MINSNIESKLVPDSALAVEMEKADCLLVGSMAVVVNWGIINNVK